MKLPLVEGLHDLPDCPYLPGASLSLEIYPFRANSFSSPKVAVTAQVLQPFLPFTHSQAIRIELEKNSVSSSLPNVVLLKLFDRRFLERLPYKAWSSEGESGLRQKVQDFLRTGRRPFRTTMPEFFGLGPEGKPAEVDTWINPQFLDSDISDFSWSDLKPWETEAFVYAEMVERLRRETKIYLHLSALQGTRIPRLYGIVQCVLERSEPGNELITRVPGLMLEYVDGKTLRELHVGENISEQEAECVSQDVLSSVRELQKHRVLHGDFRRANVVVRDSDRRPFIIDFVDAEEYTNATKEEWETVKYGLHEIEDAHTFLHEQGLHSPTPKVFHPTAFRNGFRTQNLDIESHDDIWRQKYVERLAADGPASEIRVNEHGKAYEWEFARWGFKSGVKTWDANDL